MNKNSQQIEKRRRKLARPYEFTAKYRAELLNADGWAQRCRCRVAHWVKRQFLSHYFGSEQVPRWRLLLRRLAGKRALPDFCLMGIAKSGTSDLATSIMLHPNVIAPLAKELHKPNPEQWRIFYPTERRVRRYKDKRGIVLLPNFSPLVRAMDVCYGLSRTRPNTKIVITLREPASRVFSGWKFDRLLISSKLPFQSDFSSYVREALDVFPVSPGDSAFGALAVSIYWPYVRFWIQCFGAQNVMIGDAGEYFLNRDLYLRRVQEFVGLPYVPTPEFETRINESPIRFPPPDADSIGRLKEFFRPYNARLWELIGEEFPWQ